MINSHGLINIILSFNKKLCTWSQFIIILKIFVLWFIYYNIADANMLSIEGTEGVLYNDTAVW